MKSTKKLFDMSSVDAVLVISEKNRMYFTGFASTFGYLVLLPNEKSVFITDPRYFEMAQTLQNDGVEVRQISNGISGLTSVCEILNEYGAKTVGFEDTELTVAEFSSIKQSLSDFDLKSVGADINFVRSYKDATEIEYIKKAQSITDAAFSQVLSVIKPGITERDLAIELEYLMDKNGAEGLAFDTIIASGVNSSKPHAHPTSKPLALGDPITMDFGARYHGYCSDMTNGILGRT